MPARDDDVPARDPLGPRAEAWVAQSPFVGEGAAEEERAPQVDPWYADNAPFAEGREPQEESEAIAELEFGELYSERIYPASSGFYDSEVSDKPTAEAFVSDKDAKRYFETFPQLGKVSVKRATILTPSNFENLMDLMLASDQKYFVIDAHGEPKGLFMPLASATTVSATKNSLFILSGIEHVRFLIRTAKESDTFWGRASGTDADRWRRVVEVLHSKTWRQMVAGWPEIAPQVSGVDATRSLVQSRLKSLVDSLFPGKVANKQARVDRLITKMLRLQAKGIREIQFRACNIGKDSSSLHEFRRFFGADHLCAPDVRTGIGLSDSPSIDRRVVDLLGRDHRTQVFDMPSGRFAIRIIISGLSFSVSCAADTQAAVGEWVASHVMAGSTYRRGKLPIHFLETRPPVFPLDSDYATHIRCRSSFWEGVVRGSERLRQEIEAHEEMEERRAIMLAKPETEKYDEYIDESGDVELEEELEGEEFAGFVPGRSEELDAEEFEGLLDPEEQSEEQVETMPVLSLERLKMPGITGDIPLTLGSGGHYEGFFREPPSSYNGHVNLSGRVQIEEAGTRRAYDHARDHRRWPLGKARANVEVSGAISSSGPNESPIARDGTFTTSTWIVYEHKWIDHKRHSARRFVVRVIVEGKDGKKFEARAVVELIDLAGFLAIVDPKEKARPAWQTHLQFLASVRKIYHGGPKEPQFVGPFNRTLYRHRDVDPLFCVYTPAERDVLKRGGKPNPPSCHFEISQLEQPAEQRLRRYKILYDNGEWLEIGHVLCGIEGSPKQVPDKDQSAPKPRRPELIVTWSGDLGSALQALIRHFWLATDKDGNVIDKDDTLDLDPYLVKEASRSDLIGDIDGINIGSAYDPSRSLADNLNAYYGKNSRRRYHEFIANSKNQGGTAELPLVPGKKPPKLSKQARQTIAYYTNQYLIYLQLLGSLYMGTEPAKRERVDDMIRTDSPEMEIVVDYFVRFLEDGLTLEHRQGIS